MLCVPVRVSGELCVGSQTVPVAFRVRYREEYGDGWTVKRPVRLDPERLREFLGATTEEKMYYGLQGGNETEAPLLLAREHELVMSLEELRYGETFEVQARYIGRWRCSPWSRTETIEVVVPLPEWTDGKPEVTLGPPTRIPANSEPFLDAVACYSADVTFPQLRLELYGSGHVEYRVDVREQLVNETWTNWRCGAVLRLDVDEYGYGGAEEDCIVHIDEIQVGVVYEFAVRGRLHFHPSAGPGTSRGDSRLPGIDTNISTAEYTSALLTGPWRAPDATPPPLPPGEARVLDPTPERLLEDGTALIYLPEIPDELPEGVARTVDYPAPYEVQRLVDGSWITLATERLPDAENAFVIQAPADTAVLRLWRNPGLDESTRFFPHRVSGQSPVIGLKPPILASPPQAALIFADTP